MADDTFDWLGLLNRGLSVGTGLYDIFGTGRNTSTGINQTAAQAANPFGSQFQQYQAPLAATTLTPKTNEFGAARSNLFGGYSNALMQPTTNQFGAGRSSLFGQYQDLLADPNKFTSDPFYQWQQEQGLGNLERSLAGRGLLDSGNALTEITKFGQGLAGQSYGNRLAQLQGGIGTASGLYGQDVSQLGAGADRAANLLGQDWEQLYRLSGAQQGSPSQAGQILAGRYGQLRNALGDIGYGLRGGSGSMLEGGASNPLNQLINQGISKGIKGVSDWFGGAPATYGAGDTPANLAQLYSDYGWGEAADTGGGSAVDSLSSADWSSIFGGGGGAPATYGVGDTAANLAAYYGGGQPFGAGSAAAATGAGGAATFGAGDTAANLAAYYGGQTAAPTAAAGIGGGAAGEGSSLLAGAGNAALAFGPVLAAIGISQHQFAKDDRRRAEAEGQYLPALQNWMQSNPQFAQEYHDLLQQYSGQPGFAGSAFARNHPELSRIVSANWLPSFLYQEYGKQPGLLSDIDFDRYAGSGLGDA